MSLAPLRQPEPKTFGAGVMYFRVAKNRYELDKETNGNILSLKKGIVIG
jgi:hypothetical protein